MLTPYLQTRWITE